MEHNEINRQALGHGRDTQIRGSVTLRSVQDVLALLERSRDLFRHLNVSKVSVAMEELPPPVRPILETRLNVYLKECGCAASNVAAAFSILMYVSLLFLFVGNPLAWAWKHLFIGIPICLCFAIAGKLLSQFRARRKFINVLESILLVFRADTP